MSNTAREVMEMLEMLPHEEQTLAYEMVKRLVLAWDPDFTKATKSEAARIEEGLQDIAAHRMTPMEDIDWD